MVQRPAPETMTCTDFVVWDPEPIGGASGEVLDRSYVERLLVAVGLPGLPRRSGTSQAWMGEPDLGALPLLSCAFNMWGSSALRPSV